MNTGKLQDSGLFLRSIPNPAVILSVAVQKLYITNAVYENYVKPFIVSESLSHGSSTKVSKSSLYRLASNACKPKYLNGRC